MKPLKSRGTRRVQSWTRIVACLGVAMTASVVAPQQAAACNWYMSASNILPGQLRTVLYDVQTVAPYGTRRAKWNGGNDHLTGVSYSYDWAPDVYEYTDIPYDSRATYYFTTAHPSYYQYGGNDIDVRVRNKGPRHTISPHGQVCL